MLYNPKVSDPLFWCRNVETKNRLSAVFLCGCYKLLCNVLMVGGTGIEPVASTV